MSPSFSDDALRSVIGDQIGAPMETDEGHSHQHAVCDTGRSKIAVSWGAATHVGNVRTLNEDAVLADAPVFVVADGMGGHQGGEIASGLAVESMAALSGRIGLRRSDILQAVHDANALIHSRSDGSERSMGTTITGVVIAATRTGHEVAIVNVGDSRTYRLRAGELVQLTIDHSHVQELIDAGLLDAADAPHHPERNVVTRALGIEASVEPDVVAVAVVPGDRLLVCSDGLTGELDSVDIVLAMQHNDPQEVAERLVFETLTKAARDNVSVIVIDIGAIDEYGTDQDRTDPRAVRLTADGTPSPVDFTDRRPDRRAPELIELPGVEPLALKGDRRGQVFVTVPSWDQTPVVPSGEAGQVNSLALIDDVPMSTAEAIEIEDRYADGGFPERADVPTNREAGEID